MNRKFIFAFAAVAAMFGSAVLTSCSNDDEVAGGSPVSPQSSPISYNFGFNGKATRGLGLVSGDAGDESKIPNMQVWAYYAPDASGTGAGRRSFCSHGRSYLHAGLRGVSSYRLQGACRDDG